MRTVAELTLGREPDAVPRARRLVRSALEDELPSLAADGELVVSELVTNAALHGEPPITVRVLSNHAARIEVHDAGRSAPILLTQGHDAMTGRGLSMVAAVASRWGVEPLETGGKVVWAELDAEGPAGDAVPAPVIDLDALLEAWADEDPATATYTVHLGPVPTDLLLAAKSHIDNVVRELMLMREGQASSGVQLPPELTELIRTVTVEFAEARKEIKRQAAAAAARGDVLTDLELHLSPSAAGAGERYLDALDQADRYARSAHLLTLAPPRIHRVFRRWYVHAVVDQLRALARGAEPPPPMPLQVILAGEVQRLDEAAAEADRLAMLQRISRELARAVGPRDMAAIAVDRAVEFLSVETARVRLLDEGGMLRTVAWRHRRGLSDHRLLDLPLESDLPVAVAARTGQPVHVRSLGDTLGGVPEVAGHYGMSESGHAVPLMAEGELLGVLTLSFTGGELTDQAELIFVSELADVLSQALRRAGIDRAARTREELEQAHENLRFVLEATTRVVASLDSDDTLRTLARIAVPALADICLIDLLDGVSFRRAATAAEDTVDADLVEDLVRAVPDPAGDHPAATALRTGRAVIRDPSTDRFAAELGVQDWMAIPLAARGRALGAMTLIRARPGRRYSVADTAMVEDLGRRVALAIDNTQLYESTREAERRLAFVARAGVSLTSSLDLDTVASRLCTLVSGQVADYCEVHVRRAPDQWWRFASGSSLSRMVREDHLPARVAEAVESRRTVVARAAAGEVFSARGGGAGDPVGGETVATVLPLVVHDDVVGVIALASPGAGGPARVSGETVEVIAGRAALAIDNALLYEQERTAAEILQRSLLPHRLPSVPGVRAAARYLPAGARNEIGGDWYDVMLLGPGRLGVVMGDVMGRGIPAASIMGQLRNGLRMLALQDMEPAAALALLNRLLGADPDSPLATVVYGVIDTAARTLSVANAGHLPPLLVRRSAGRFLDLKAGLPLGAFPDAAYTTVVHHLEAGDALVMYTDGLIEQRDRGLEEGLGALLTLAGTMTVTDPDAVCEALLESFRDDTDEDDTAALVLILDSLDQSPARRL